MRKKRKIESKYYWIIILAISASLLALMMYTVRDNRKLNFLEQGVQDVMLSIQKVVSSPFRFIEQQIKTIHKKNKIYNTYQQLESKVQMVEAMEAKNKELEFELQEMKKLLEYNQTLTESTYVSASVLVRNIDTWYQTLIIDKGSKQGIQEGNAVVTSQGLIGEIIHTSNFYSTVKLLTGVTANHKISIKIEGTDNYIYGLLSDYDTKKNYYKIEGIAENSEIVEGASIITTGLGNHFPAGILIGTVAEVKTDHFDLARTVLVKPSVDINAISYVTVLTKQVIE